MTISSIPNTSLPLWVPDEEILAENINLRERKYGGFYQQDNIGSTTLSPIFTTPASGELWGSPVYGFQQYNSVAGAGLFTDNITTGNTIPTFTEAIATNIYGNSILYGFMAYGNSPSGTLNTDSIALSDNTMSFTSGSAYGQYGPSNFYGFMQYGNTNLFITETITYGEVAPVNSTVILTGFQYGDGTKWGFNVYQA